MLRWAGHCFELLLRKGMASLIKQPQFEGGAQIKALEPDKFHARDDLPLEHGYLLAITLMEHTKSLAVTAPLNGMFGMTIHPGAQSAAPGETIVPLQPGD